MATTSACAVGSFVEVTQFAPAAMMRPALTTTAAKGPPRPERTFSTARLIVSCMKALGMMSPAWRAPASNCTGKGQSGHRGFMMLLMESEIAIFRCTFVNMHVKSFLARAKARVVRRCDAPVGLGAVYFSGVTLSKE